MGRRLAWEKRLLDGKRKVSTRDEADLMTRDLASKWLARAESKQQMQRQQLNKTKSALPLRSGPKARQRAGAPKKFKDLRPDDPHHQLENVDLTTMPWED